MSLATLDELDYTRSMSDQGSGLDPFEMIPVSMAAQERGVSTTTIYTAYKNGEIRGKKLGHIYLVMRGDVQKWNPRPRGRKPKQGG